MECADCNCSVQLLELALAGVSPVGSHISLAQVELCAQVTQLHIMAVIQCHGLDTSQDDVLGCDQDKRRQSEQPKKWKQTRLPFIST